MLELDQANAFTSVCNTDCFNFFFRSQLAEWMMLPIIKINNLLNFFFHWKAFQQTIWYTNTVIKINECFFYIKKNYFLCSFVVWPRFHRFSRVLEFFGRVTFPCFFYILVFALIKWRKKCVRLFFVHFSTFNKNQAVLKQ